MDVLHRLWLIGSVGLEFEFGNVVPKEGQRHSHSATSLSKGEPAVKMPHHSFQANHTYLRGSFSKISSHPSFLYDPIDCTICQVSPAVVFTPSPSLFMGSCKAAGYCTPNCVPSSEAVHTTCLWVEPFRNKLFSTAKPLATHNSKARDRRQDSPSSAWEHRLSFINSIHFPDLILIPLFASTIVYRSPPCRPNGELNLKPPRLLKGGVPARRVETRRMSGACCPLYQRRTRCARPSFSQSLHLTSYLDQQASSYRAIPVQGQGGRL